MNLIKLINQHHHEIISGAIHRLMEAQFRHYETEGIEVIEERYSVLLDRVLDCISERNLIPISEYAESIARARYESGYPLDEVLSAINLLEEQCWDVIKNYQYLPEQAQSFGLISKVLGAAKESLSETYVELASKQGKKSFFISELFGGTAGV